MRRKLLLLAIATVLACVTAATGLAAGSTQVTHFSFTKPSNVCGISGTTVGHGTSVFRDTGNGTYFMSGHFVGVFTADNGKSTTLSFAGPAEANIAGRDRRAGGDGHDHDDLRWSVREAFDHPWSDIES